MGLENSETKLIRFEYVIGTGYSSPGWQPHSRRFVYYADNNGKTPDFLLNTEKTNGFILRNGQLTHKKGGRPHKQRGVDVLLAVDAMQHSFRKSMTHCTIYTSDGDFLPLIDELVASGTFVRVKSFNDPEKGDVAPLLRRSADSYERMGVLDIYRGLPDEMKKVGSHWALAESINSSNAEKLQFHSKDAHILKVQNSWNVLFDSGSEETLTQITFRSREACILFLKFGFHNIPMAEWGFMGLDKDYPL